MDAPKRKQRKTYDARVEFLAVQADVAKMMAEGHRIKAVFERLTMDGRITVSYTTFCDYVRGGGNRLRRADQRRGQTASATVQSAQPSVSAPPRTVVARPEKKEPFFHDKDVDIKDLV